MVVMNLLLGREWMTAYKLSLSRPRPDICFPQAAAYAPTISLLRNRLGSSCNHSVSGEKSCVIAFKKTFSIFNFHLRIKRYLFSYDQFHLP